MGTDFGDDPVLCLGRPDSGLVTGALSAVGDFCRVFEFWRVALKLNSGNCHFPMNFVSKLTFLIVPAC